jgi:hypothetical protein
MMRRTREVNVHGFIGFGDTVKEARQDAVQQIECLSKGDWTPILLEWLDTAILVYRTDSSWAYTFIRTNNCALSMGGTCFISGGKDITLQGAQNALVQAAWQPDMDLDAFPLWFTDEEARKDQIYDRKRLIRVKQLMSSGHTVDEALDVIGGRIPERVPVSA